MTNEKIVEVINNLYYLISEDCTDTQNVDKELIGVIRL